MYGSCSSREREREREGERGRERERRCGRAVSRRRARERTAFAASASCTMPSLNSSADVLVGKPRQPVSRRRRPPGSVSALPALWPWSLQLLVARFGRCTCSPRALRLASVLQRDHARRRIPAARCMQTEEARRWWSLLSLCCLSSCLSSVCSGLSICLHLLGLASSSLPAWVLINNARQQCMSTMCVNNVRPPRCIGQLQQKTGHTVQATAPNTTQTPAPIAILPVSFCPRRLGLRLTMSHSLPAVPCPDPVSGRLPLSYHSLCLAC